MSSFVGSGIRMMMINYMLEMMIMMMMMMVMITMDILSIPDPGTIEPLDHKLPKDIGSEGADFTLKCLDKVETKYFMLFNPQVQDLCISLSASLMYFCIKQIVFL